MDATQLVHLMGGPSGLLDACETAPHGYTLHLAPWTTPERITCPECRELIAVERLRDISRDHAEALAEDAAHDAAVNMAEELTCQLLAKYMDRPAKPLPYAARQQARRPLIIPPRRA